MPTVYASNSGYVYRFRTESWATVRDNASGTVKHDNVSHNSFGIRALHTAGRGANSYMISRSYFYFDTSGITGTVSSATLKIYGVSQSTADVIAIKSTAFGGDGGTAIALADYSAIDFSTAYSAELATWSTSGYNDITLNVAAATDMKNNNAFIVCLVEHDHDYANSAVTGNQNFTSGLYYDPVGGTSKDPYIDYVVATGYGNSVNSVASANIGKIDGVATASIEKLIGV